MSTQESSEGLLARLRRFAIVAVIVALAGGVVFLLSERNSRSYFLYSEAGSLVIARGARLPFGKVAWAPEDPALAEAYGRIALPTGAAEVPEQRFDERQDLDRALFDLLAGWADTRIRTDDPIQVREGLAFVERAARLQGIEADQRRRLRVMQAELAWYEGRDRLERGGKLIEEARAHLRLATEASPARAREALLLLNELEPALERLSRVVHASRGLHAAQPALPAAAIAPEQAPAAGDGGAGGAAGAAGAGGAAGGAGAAAIETAHP